MDLKGFYFLAANVWLVNAVTATSDFIGASCVLVGLVLGVLFLKMQRNE